MCVAILYSSHDLAHHLGAPRPNVLMVVLSVIPVLLHHLHLGASARVFTTLPWSLRTSLHFRLGLKLAKDSQHRILQGSSKCRLHCNAHSFGVLKNLEHPNDVRVVKLRENIELLLAVIVVDAILVDGFHSSQGPGHPVHTQGYRAVGAGPELRFDAVLLLERALVALPKEGPMTRQAPANSIWAVDAANSPQDPWPQVQKMSDRDREWLDSAVFIIELLPRGPRESLVELRIGVHPNHHRWCCRHARLRH
mmetsp:Transcript_68543/g.164623  ORF Transcript_68543/g.164623 Transcript_68543/m.164623 type:complete len:251 (-) Transcript_68543:1153-1905(-)